MSFWRHPDFAKRLVVGALLSAIAFPLIVWPIYGGPLLWPDPERPRSRERLGVLLRSSEP